MKQVKAIQKLLAKFWWAIPVVLVLASAGVALLIMQKPIAKPSQFAHTDKNGFPQCVDTDASNFTCWQVRYQDMVAKQSTQAAFADVKKAYTDVPYVKTNCHQIMHVIGRAAAKKYDNSVAKAYNQGDNFCWSGYYHGVMEQVSLHLGKDQLLATMNDICAEVRKNQQYSFYHYNCVHGLGHGVMAIENDQLFTALQDCDRLTDSWEAESCYGGAFMENVMAEINPGEHTDYLKNDQPLYPCTAVDTKYKEQCYLMQTSHALKVVNYDFAKVFSLCSSVENPYNLTCYESLGRDASGSTVSNQDQTKAYCMLGQSEDAKNHCFIGAVKDFISFFHSDQQGLALCRSIPDGQLSSNCIATAKDYYSTF